MSVLAIVVSGFFIFLFPAYYCTFSSVSSWFFVWACYTGFYFVNAFTATFCSHVTAQSTAEWSRSRSPSNLVSGHDSMMWLIVCTPPHWHLSDDVMCHLWRWGAHRPCPVQKWFNKDHAERPRLKPGSPIVMSVMRFLLATEMVWL